MAAMLGHETKAPTLELLDRTVASQSGGAGIELPENIQQRTSNVQLRMKYYIAPGFDVGCWMLDVGCWMFDLPSQNGRENDRLLNMVIWSVGPTWRVASCSSVFPVLLRFGNQIESARGLAQSKTPAPAQTPTTDPRPPDSRISAAELDRAIDRVLEQREFNWRLPREKRVQDSSQKGIFAGFMDGVADTIRSWGRAAARWLKAAVVWLTDVIDWLREKIFGKGKIGRAEGRTGTAWITSLQILIFVLVALAASVAAVLIYRMWRQRGRRLEVSSEGVAAVPDVADENVVANQLPEDDWLRLARELIGRGELRLAVRALYLASLAHLAQRDMISVAKFKSNRDYELELRRRARALPDLQAAFAENVGIFDRVWYGLHEVTEERLQRFQLNLERIKAC
jgi:hypothetical protein